MRIQFWNLFCRVILFAEMCVSTYPRKTELNDRMMRRPNCCVYGKSITRRDFSISIPIFREPWTPFIAPRLCSTICSCIICVTVRSISHKPESKQFSITGSYIQCKGQVVTVSILLLQEKWILISLIQYASHR